MDVATEIIKNSCERILVMLREGAFERKDLEFLQTFFTRIVAAATALLEAKKN